MSTTSGPMLPERTGNVLVFPEERSLSSKFLVVMA
jgi:hypothetical protein